MQDSLIGTVVDGRYAITALVGRGGMATVYRARDKRLERDIAIKLMHPHLAEKSDLNARFNKEARAAAQLSSPYVVAIHDQGVWASPDGPRAYLVMEYVPGPDLRSELQRLGSLSLGSCLDITEQVLRALAAAHEAGIIHRDVKPENILLGTPLSSDSADEDDAIQAKVADFGLAHVVDADSAGTGTVLGTVAYIPPESVGSGIFEPPADLYALGIMMYEVITGQLPFKGETPMQTAYMHITKPMPDITDKAEWMPEEVCSFVALLTAKDPDERPANGKEALAQFLAMRESIDEESLSKRIAVAPTAPRPAVKEEVEEPYQEKTVAYAKVPGSLPVSPDDSALDNSVGSGGYRVQLSATSTPTEALPLSEINDLDEKASASQSDEAAPSNRSHEQALEKDKKHKKNAVATADDDDKATNKKRWIVIFLAVVLLALAATGAWYFLAGPGKRVMVPDVTGQEAVVAEKKLSDAGFKVERKEAYSDDVAEGLVISTTPGHKKVRVGSTVTMTVSLGIEQVEVPAVVELTREDAINKMKSARLHPKVKEEYSETVAENIVISQSIEGGTKVNHDSSVELVISLGREPINVPSLANMSRDEAVQALESAGLTAQITEDYSDTVPAGQVISQNPENGTLYRGDPVSVVISKGPPVVKMPRLVGMSESKARATLEGLGLVVDVHKPMGVALGLVHSQDPEPGTTVRIGSTVRINVV